VQYEDKEEIFLGPHSIMGIYKVTDELAGVETARSAGTGIGTREQHHVETRLVRAVNDRCFLSKPVEKLSAVSTLGGISLQRSTPFRAPVVEGRVTEGPVNSEEGIDNLSIRTYGAVPNFPFPSGPQMVEFGLLHSSARPLELIERVAKGDREPPNLDPPTCSYPGAHPN
jgi:hypothetical protein